MVDDGGEAHEVDDGGEACQVAGSYPLYCTEAEAIAASPEASAHEMSGAWMPNAASPMIMDGTYDGDASECPCGDADGDHGDHGDHGDGDGDEEHHDDHDGHDHGDEEDGECPLGTVSAAGESDCTPCSRGTYSDELGQTTCKIAAPGTYVAVEGASAATHCPVGTFSGAAASSCTPCPLGYYSNRTGQSSCQLCETPTTTLERSEEHTSELQSP